MTGGLISSVPVAPELVTLDYNPTVDSYYGILMVAGGVTLGAGTGVILTGSGTNDVATVDRVAGTVTVVSGGHEKGITNFISTLECLDHRILYVTSGQHTVWNEGTWAQQSLPQPVSHC